MGSEQFVEIRKKRFFKIINFLRITFLIVWGVLSLGMLFSLFLWYKHLDPQGDPDYGCGFKEFPAVSNNANLIVTAHNTICGFGDSNIYVYVHSISENESKKTLVFRYDDTLLDEPPKIEWINSSTLHISVGHVNEISKLIPEIGGVKVLYTIGKVE